MPKRNGRRLADLEGLLDDPRQRRVALLELFRELVAQERAATDNDERERATLAALVVFNALSIAQNIIRVTDRFDEINARIDALAQVMREHDGWAHAEALAGNEWRQEQGDE